MQAIKSRTLEAAFRVALDQLEDQLEEAEEAYADAQWRRHFDLTVRDELSQLEARRSDLLLGNRMRQVLRYWEERSLDPLLARRVTMLLRRFHWAEIESQPQVYRLRNRIDQAISSFRPQISGAAKSRVERSQILRRHPDRERRREAWMAMTPLAVEIESNVCQLMRQRQELARQHGYDGFVSWALDAIGLRRQWVERFLDELRVLTDAAYFAWLDEMGRHLSLDDGLRPWDLAFAAEQGIGLPAAWFPRDGSLPAVHKVAEGMGLGTEAAGVQVDVADIPHAALCYAVRPPGDVRILLNPRDGKVHYDVLFHEFGHALHWRCVRQASPALCWESPSFNEAMACLWGRWVSEPEWLMEQDNITPDQVREYRRGWAKRAIYRLRLRMAQAAFEYRAYHALDGDLSALFRKVFAEYLGVPYNEAPGWADSPFWTSHPVYFQNYVIGEAVASQSLAALRRRFGRLIGNPKVGAWLTKHYYDPGASLPWNEKVLLATGEALGARDLVVDLGCG